MANEKINELLAKLQSDPQALAAIAALADEAGAVSFFVEQAKKFGIDLSEDDIRVAVAEATKTQAAGSDAAASKLHQVGEEDLDAVAGGVQAMICHGKLMI